MSATEWNLIFAGAATSITAVLAVVFAFLLAFSAADQRREILHLKGEIVELKLEIQRLLKELAR